jgi:ParB-like chromosome segregation protein Spo0J
MPPSNKKRFNAFDDFPAGEGAQTPLQPIAQQTQSESVKVERIERLKPSEMIPDRFQPRRLLPAHLRQAFYRGEIDCYQAASEWIKFGQHDSGVKAEIERLLSLGNSFEEHGQIKPITGSWVTATNGNFIFVIETGERRFWAACLQTVSHKMKDEPLLRVEVIDTPTRQRQVLENRHAETPSAVEQACEVAALILAELNITPDNISHDDYDYFRLARAQRMPAGLWDRIMPIMQLTRVRMVQLLNILSLPSALLEMADRFRLPERVLREILAQPAREWESLIHKSIQNSLTSDDIADVVHSEQSRTTENNATPAAPKAPSTPQRNAQRSLRRFTGIFRKMNAVSQSALLDDLADDLVVSGHAAETVEVLNELMGLLQARLRRK